MKTSAAEPREPERFVPALGFERLTALYDPVVRLTTREARFKRRLLDQASLRSGQRVLDLACGTGTLAVSAKVRAPGAHVQGLDGDPAVLRRARAKAYAVGVEVEFREGRSEHLPYADGSFDVVLSTLFFHHLSREAKERSTREIARVLVPGGSLHVADWGPPGDPLMRLLFTGVRALDGFEPTRDNATGALPAIFRSAGLESGEESGRLRTMFGSLAFYASRRPRE
ncbi:MAG: hypothetical protein AVDCRST_MAG45-333 [uncultured Solirubrobacterales bacterium]|uniref:Methyltransferase domain-containing protein n=1 Tax=uncultured Solirubrobacterales bacterium TaxID=768556 RepID=A0A6J4S2V7_9ACTN|nr:MAG: hypothetical protein AVDCRST_MAG45-333 [uncultured Solirubrobacterales bacterium]